VEEKRIREDGLKEGFGSHNRMRIKGPLGVVTVKSYEKIGEQERKREKRTVGKKRGREEENNHRKKRTQSDVQGERASRDRKGEERIPFGVVRKKHWSIRLTKKNEKKKRR